VNPVRIIGVGFRAYRRFCARLQHLAGARLAEHWDVPKRLQKLKNLKTNAPSVSPGLTPYVPMPVVCLLRAPSTVTPLSCGRPRTHMIEAYARGYAAAYARMCCGDC